MEGLKAELFLRNKSENYSTRFVSMLGNVVDGVKTKNYGAPLVEAKFGTIVELSNIPDLDKYDYPNGVNDSGELRTEPLPGCFGNASVTCAGNGGITLTEANFRKLFLFPKPLFNSTQLELDPATWAQSTAAYLTFEPGQLVDVLDNK